ncbi:MAG TPA: sulfatase-like hydrolase/transferase, partial [Ignavibacteriaceae bacterium]
MKKNKSDYTRRNFIKKAGVAAAALPFINSFGLPKEKINRVAEFNPDSETPNIILILSDDHLYNSLGFMGKFGFLGTPNIDRMAKEGAHIQNTFVTTALCSPSRASILTGMYTHKHGVVDNDSPVPPQNIFFPEYLQQRGYETAFIGKWHMGNITDEPRKGFDRWISFKGQGVYYNPEMNIDGTPVRREGYITDILTEYSVEYLKQKHEKPFFLILSHKAVHAMFEPAERHKGKYKNAKIEYPDTMANTEENYTGKPGWVKEQRNGWHGVDYMYHGELGVSFDDFIRLYCETLLALDDSVGSVLYTLEETGLDKNSMMFY